MLSTLISHFVVGLVGVGVGWYLHYRYGTKVKNAIATVETRIQSDAKKL